ncbi:tRNA (guanosine(46)-N7)-methyltransferase TrmB [Campylobacter sp. RM15925]|uniref:tRNA (guanosine(46)-N7)-methyltransferase TrmB n=1 Tax=Campylobacter sp. RM15925 TaxID=1705724 RepID=UPI00147323E7|nr:tRNA (guanosine(46)-N7)-methyltransferase TrmB [Campylobacter sp. RM15925]
MPNFVAKNLKFNPLPFGDEDIKFQWEAKGRNSNLIYTKSGGEEFFIVIKKREKEGFVIKGEKLTKPAKIGLLQRALVKFKELNCKEILTEAMAVKKTHLTQKSSAIVDTNEILEILKESKFSKIFIEIGFGSGRHLLYQAETNADALVIGIEVYKPSLEQVAKLAKAKNLSNVALINTDARLLLSLIKSNFIDRIFLHFPVPWDDAPHRRVVSEKFIKECERTLKNGGKFELRSDSRAYTDYTIEQILNLTSAKLSIYKNRNLAVSSKYEDRWKKQSKDIYDAVFECEAYSPELEMLDELKFEHGYDTQKIASNFKNFTIKMDDCFLHLEEKFELESGEILIRVAFGAFASPEHCYVLVGNQKCEYLIKKPLVTRENLKAHLALKEYLANAKNN